MASKAPPEKTPAPKHHKMDTELDRAPREGSGPRLAAERGSLAQGVDLGGISPGKSGGANLA